MPSYDQGLTLQDTRLCWVLGGEESFWCAQYLDSFSRILAQRDPTHNGNNLLCLLNSSPLLQVHERLSGVYRSNTNTVATQAWFAFEITLPIVDGNLIVQGKIPKCPDYKYRISRYWLKLLRVSWDAWYTKRVTYDTIRFAVMVCEASTTC
jgi:hypothetical protein